ncbi:FHA domain-containing protein [Frisingicoccus sp.]|uniref:FHA domain-containing protein n=1 Tax=Frisingicoccus sp. TaxID=1918627 RepID=UPI003AB5450A
MRDGVDIKKQRLGSGKGDIFTGNLEDRATNIVADPALTVWNMVFQNICTGTSYRYRFCGKMYIGREPFGTSPDRMLRIKEDAWISKLHCMIYEEGHRLYLADLNSRNHTFVNEQKIEVPVVLKNGDVIRIGKTELKVLFGR